MERIRVYLINLGKYVEGCLVGEWIMLPIKGDDLDAVLKRIGINAQYEEYFITDFEHSLANLKISEYESIETLNEFVEELENLSDYDYEKLMAVLEAESPTSVSEIMEIIHDIDSFELLPDVTTDYELGEYYADCCCIFESVPHSFMAYFDYESYGRDIRLELNCCFTSYGVVIDNR